MDSLIEFLKSDLDAKEFTDTTITFIDRESNIDKIDAHRVILAAMSPVFRLMFKFENKIKYDVNIANTNCAINLVKEFYGITCDVKKDWLYILNELATKHFLGIDVDKKILYDLVVPEEGFDLFMELVEMVYDSFNSIVEDRSIIKCIRHNLPTDTTQLNLLVSTEIDRLKYISVTQQKSTLIFNDSYGKQFLVQFYRLSRYVQIHANKCIFSLDRRLLILLPNYLIIRIDDIINHMNKSESDQKIGIDLDDNHKLISSFFTQVNGYDSIVSPDNTYLAANCDVGLKLKELRIFNIKLQKCIIFKHIPTTYTGCLAFTSDSKKILCICYDQYNYIQIIDVLTGIFHQKIQMKVTFGCNNPYLKISPNGKFIMVRTFMAVQIYELINYSNIKHITTIQENTCPIEFSPDSNLVLTQNNHDISLWNIPVSNLFAATKMFEAQFPFDGDNIIRTSRFSTDGQHIIVSFKNFFCEIDINQQVITTFRGSFYKELITVIEQK